MYSGFCLENVDLAAVKLIHKTSSVVDIE